MIIAAIDIGSNAARLLITEVTGKDGNVSYTKLNMLRMPLRLGMDVFLKQEIGAVRRQMVIDSMKIFADLMKFYEVQEYRACATSAMRDAANGPEIIEMVKKTSGINIEIISGDEEAALVFENHVAEEMDRAHNYLYIDVGGGSTELTYFENGHMSYERSFNIGTIRLLNNLVDEAAWKEMRNAIKENLKSKKKIIAIGSGGNINKAFSMSKTKEGNPISAEYLKRFHSEIEKLTVEQRMEKYKMREDRADVFEPALRIYNNVLNWAGISEIYVPKISVADGLIHSIYNKMTKK